MIHLMSHLNIRRKMICCVCLYITFAAVYGVTFLKDFRVFNEDVSLLMHAGNLSNICLELRRYEKNFIIRHDEEDFRRVGEYVDKAQKYVPEVKNDLLLIPHPLYLEDLQKVLADYEKIFYVFKRECTPESSDSECTPRVTLRQLGQDLVSITKELVLYEQQKMTAFIDNFRDRLLLSIAILALLSFFTLFVLYGTIIRPLKSIEKAAVQVAKGTFRQLPLPAKRDEVTSVLHAFNKMVAELEQQQEQLFEAKKLSSIGTLASGTAHQINNPLNNIATSCQLALAETDEERSSFTTQMLKTIDQETQRAGEIVRGLLEFSRAQTFSMQPVRLKTVVNKALQLAASEVPSGVTVEHDVPDELILYLDVQKMVEAFLNLLINAIQSIENPPGKVSITASAKDNQAIIILEDTGVGIDKENLQKVFDPFFTTKDVDSGTGLGLAVVYGIIKKHNGTIKVESEHGKGTRFIVALPHG
jgi:two-component system NtrC family sensor kinase